MSELTPKQTLFILEYLKDLNATQAAIRAGYSKKTAGQIGDENLKKPQIKAEIDKAMKERIEKTKIDANWVLERLAEEVQADISDLYGENGALLPVSQWPMIWRQGLVSGIDVHQEYAYEDGKKIPDGMIMKVKLSDRIKRIELIGKHVDVMAFATKVEHTGKDDGPIELESVNDMELARKVAYVLMNGAEHATH